LWKNMRARRYVQGGSTITQQLMKNLFFTRQKAISRKAKEIVFALVTEARHSKEAILEAYLNEVYFGQTAGLEIHGIAEAARHYFDRPVTDLSLAESATLAAIVQLPEFYNPRKSPQRVFARRNLVLKKMLDAAFIEESEYRQATEAGLGIVPPERSLEDANYFLDAVMRELPESVKSQLDNGALAVYVTMDPKIQAVASRVLAFHIDRLQKSVPILKKKASAGIKLQGAMVAIDLKGCSIAALQGGQTYRQTQFNRVLSGHRQAGSLFKPFVYLAAFSRHDREFTPVTEMDDSPFEWSYEGQKWSPKNYDNQYRGKVTLRKALEESINVPTARLAQRVGLDQIIDVMVQAGIQSSLPKVPSIALGSADVTPLELAQAFSTLANEGKHCPLRALNEVYDANGNLLFQNKVEWTEKLDPAATFQTIDLMKGVFISGTARSARSSGIHLEHFAGKTGTTSEYKDAWFVGFSPSLLALVWVGYDEEEKVGLSGSAAALPIWIDFIKNIQTNVTDEDFPVPSGVTKLEIDTQTLKQASDHCPSKRVEYFAIGTEPPRCPQH
ncbi:MAG: transglycosylase domain-containing protein, partial [Deltaproteobacteria bacterium]|nr:transglycosylase domain-containing protein [Deltaproteobacteria bacterium]